MAGWDDSIFGNLPPRRPKRPITPTPGAAPVYTADDIVAGRSPFGKQEARSFDDPTISGQLGQSFERGAERLGAPMSVQRSAGDIGSFVGGATGLDMPQHLSDAWNYLRNGAPGRAALSAAAAVPVIPGAAGAKVAAKTAEEVATGAAAKGGITAYHGSPYNFDRFDISKIGTGEGAQAYGHGLYFAQNEDVAKEYRDTLSKLDFSEENLTDEGRAKFEEMQTADPWRSRDSTLNILPEMYFKPTGSMYQVNINANPDHFLDWDKPLSEQHPQVQQNLADVLRYHKVPLNNNAGGETTGGQMMGYLQSRFGNDVDPASELSDNNIPGIKYLDQGSRGAGGEGGTQNYVTFSDNMIDILKKYGLAGLGLTAGAGALSASGQSPVSSPAEAAPPPQGMTLGAQPNWSP